MVVKPANNTVAAIVTLFNDAVKAMVRKTWTHMVVQDGHMIKKILTPLKGIRGAVKKFHMHEKKDKQTFMIKFTVDNISKADTDITITNTVKEPQKKSNLLKISTQVYKCSQRPKRSKETKTTYALLKNM